MRNLLILGKRLPELFINKWVLIGASLALGLIILFLSTAGDPDPSWPRYWMIRPLVVVPLAGAAGGVCFAATEWLRRRGGWYTVLGVGIGLLIYLVGLWMGIVLGLDGTWWN